MDDARIRQLRDEVLAAIREPAPLSAEEASLSTRVAALEDAVRALQAPARPSPRSHPSLRLLDVPKGVECCVLEPDKPCIESGRCRAFGH
jgi:hypothetical protein